MIVWILFELVRFFCFIFNWCILIFIFACSYFSLCVSLYVAFRQFYVLAWSWTGCNKFLRVVEEPWQVGDGFSVTLSGDSSPALSHDGRLRAHPDARSPLGADRQRGSLPHRGGRATPAHNAHPVMNSLPLEELEMYKISLSSCTNRIFILGPCCFVGFFSSLL